VSTTEGAPAREADIASHVLGGAVDLHYLEAGSGPPLVMLHGSGPGVSAWSNYRRTIPALARHFQVLAPDMPGFGRSGLPELRTAYPHVAAAGVLRLLDHLGLERAHVFGNSMGGYVALELALAAPDRVGRLVLMGPGGLSVNTFGPDQSEGARRLGEFMLAPTREAMEAWLDTMVGRAFVDDALIDERMEGALAPGAITSAMSIFLSLAQHPDPSPLWARLGGVTAPTLVFWGRDDRMMPLEGGLFGFRRLPDAELHVFSRCGHWAQVERKDDLERLTIEFLTRGGGAPA
jgi:4,5:9,10-diseco-3-hydroxy-5,9,17-trioxoandrosta-1(10),2-diene-4-oate hydrolase